MTNRDLQEKLDKKTWEESAREFCDLSGAMEYCDFCKAQNGQLCGASQSERESFALCAKAYNKKNRSK